MKIEVKARSILFTAVTLLMLSACVSTGKYDAMVAERDVALAQRDSLAAQKAELEAAYDDLNELLAEEIAANTLALRELVDGVEVEIPSDVLFRSGAALPAVSDESREQFLKLADYLKDTDFFISVVGHTDSQQPTPRLAERYPTNWELGGARAAVAARFLEREGVDPTRITANSRGEHVPVTTNDTAEGRAKNRRIQIILRTLPEG
jgi:chemotaxis protein MotB